MGVDPVGMLGRTTGLAWKRGMGNGTGIMGGDQAGGLMSPGGGGVGIAGRP